MKYQHQKIKNFLVEKYKNDNFVKDIRISRGYYGEYLIKLKVNEDWNYTVQEMNQTCSKIRFEVLDFMIINFIEIPTRVNNEGKEISMIDVFFRRF